ncbi:hypothetical protein LINPERHAP1_LOCUS34554 [Linum perenne]
MLCLIGGFLFPNKSTQYVHLIWCHCLGTSVTPVLSVGVLHAWLGCTEKCAGQVMFWRSKLADHYLFCKYGRGSTFPLLLVHHQTQFLGTLMNVQLPHPWEYPFPNADPSHTFTHPP